MEQKEYVTPVFEVESTFLENSYTFHLLSANIPIKLSVKTKWRKVCTHTHVYNHNNFLIPFCKQVILICRRDKFTFVNGFVSFLITFYKA